MRGAVLAVALLVGAGVGPEVAEAASVAEFGSLFSVARVLADGAPTDSIVFGFELTAVTAAPDSFGWFNLVGPGDSWLIRNQPIPLSGFSTATPWLNWAREADGRIGAAPVGLSAIVSATPFEIAPVPDGDWTTVELTAGTLAYFFAGYAGILPGGGAGPPPFFDPVPPARPVDFHHHIGFQGLQQSWNECAPTSTATSIYWLGRRHGFADRLPAEPVDLITDLARRMSPGWEPVEGLPDQGGRADRGYPGVYEEGMLAGKRGYLETLGFRGGVAWISGWSSKALLDWLRKGVDLELWVDWDDDLGGHSVTVTGIVINEDGSGWLTVLDPWLGNLIHTWRFTKDGYFPDQGGTFRAAFAETVPEPGTWAMMIAGFGLVGGMARRRRELAPA